MLKQRFSIRIMLLLITGALTVMIAALSLKDLYVNAHRLSELERLRDASTLGDQLFAATQNLSLERDLTISMLQARDAETISDLAPRLADTRASVDAAFYATLTAFEQYRFEELHDLRAALVTRLTYIRDLREDADIVLAAPDRSRAIQLSGDIAEQVDGLIGDSERLWVGFIGHFVAIDPIATLHLRFKNVLRGIRDMSGRERAMIGQMIAQDARPTAEQVSELLLLRGSVNQAWRSAGSLGLQSGLLADITEPYSDARSHYDTLYSMARDSFYLFGASHGDAYPISADLWFELSLQADETFQSLSDATIAAAGRHLHEAIGAARGVILAQIFVLLLAAALCAVSFWVVIRRVIGPINRIVDALQATMRGEPAPLHITASQRDEVGKLVEVLGAFQSNTEEMRRTASELAHSRRRLSAVVDHAVDGVLTLSAKGAVLTVNPACERIFGYPPAELIGKAVTLLAPSLYADGEHDDLASYVASTDSQEGGATSHEVTARRKDRSTFPMDFTVSSYQIDGEYFYSVIVRDVSLRKEAEQALMGYTHALERSNKELDDFAYIASHDLKEPLRGIHNHSRFLMEDNAERLDTESANRLHRLIYLSQRMERLVNDLLYFSRLGRQELAVQTTDLAEAARDVVSTLEHFIEERNASIVIARDMPAIVCDRPRVTELLRNLITNAIKYNDRAEKVVELGYLPTKARHGRLMRNVYFVRDNGRGIDPEFHDEVFRIFKRLQSEGAEEGTGVGLTFVKKIVERHGGEIWLESELGQGTTFFFTLEGSRDDARLNPEAA